MEQAGSRDFAGQRTYVPGYTLDRGISVDRAGALVAAHDTGTGSRVTIRLLSPALTSDAALHRQVRRDMGVLGALRHQHLLAVIAFDDRHSAVVCEWVDAVTLRDLVNAVGRLDPAAALVLFDDSLSGLEALHAAGVEHRDVRPEALLVDIGGTGILRDAAIPAPPLHRGWRAGTPQYMAPELWAGRPHTVSTDLYAATGVLVESLTGQPPYLGTDLTGLGLQHTQGVLPSEAVPMIARALVISGLAKDPRDRPAGASLFRRDVEIAGTAFLGSAWRERGRAWLAAQVVERLADPVPAPQHLDEIIDDDEDDAPIAGIATFSREEPRRGGVGWKVWSVAGASLLALTVAIILAVNALGGTGQQLSPSAPPAPVFTPTPIPTDPGGAPTAADTAGAATDTPSPRPSPTPTPTAPPNTMPISLLPSPTPTPTPAPTPTPVAIATPTPR